MRKVSYIKFKWLNIFIIILFSNSIVGCSSVKRASSNNAPGQKSVCVQITESTVITFPDKNLEETIREKIQCPTGDILKDDVDKITNLENAQDKHITNLSGIENLINLTLLDLSNNQISNIEPLIGLTNLTNLALDNNKISNIEPLKELANLTSLALDNNKIKDFSPISTYYRNLERTDIAIADINTTQREISTNNQVAMSSVIIPKQEVISINNQVTESSTIIPKQEEISTNNHVAMSSVIIPKQEVISTNNQVTESPTIIPKQEVRSTNNHVAMSSAIIPKQEVINTNTNNQVTESPTIILKQEVISTNNQVAASKVITFPDKNLEKLIRDTIQQPTGDILKGDVDNITNLQNAQNKHITNLSGIENLTNLALLNLSNNEISKIEPLKRLTDLDVLMLQGNQIKDYTPVNSYYKNLKVKDFTLKDKVNTDFILPNSNIGKLKESDLGNLTKQQLTLVRNEVYARHGLVFNTQDIKSYFESKSWYRPDPAYKCDINSIESFNVQLIKKIEEGEKNNSPENTSAKIEYNND